MQSHRQTLVGIDDSARICAIHITYAALAVPFLPFTWSVSPFDTITGLARGTREGGFSFLGAPFFIAIPILCWQLRKLVSDRVSRSLTAACYVISALAMLSVSAFVVLVARAPSDVFAIDLAPASVPALVGANVLLLVRNRRAISRDDATEAFLLGAYLPNAVFCLLAFPELRGIGAWLTLAVCAGYIAVIGLLSSVKPRFSAQIATGQTVTALGKRAP